MAKTKKADDKIAQNQIMFDFVTEEVKVVVKKENSKISRKSIKQKMAASHDAATTVFLFDLFFRC